MFQTFYPMIFYWFLDNQNFNVEYLYAMCHVLLSDMRHKRKIRWFLKAAAVIYHCIFCVSYGHFSYVKQKLHSGGSTSY